MALGLLALWLGATSLPALPCHPKAAVLTSADEPIRKLFDERFYRLRYPDVEQSVRNCGYRSALNRVSDYRLSTAAVQRQYQRGVPHTDRQGGIRFRYDSSSFFPRCLYHAMAGTFPAIKEAGFNCVHTWEGYGIGDIIGELRSADLQLIKHWPTDREVSAFAADPHILAWYLDEEPTAQIYLDAQRTGDSTLMGKRFQDFLRRRAAIKGLDARHPVFSLGTAWVPPGYEDWWERWETAGDVTVHDNYCLLSTTTDFESLTTSVASAVAINREQKPVWLTLQAFSGTADRKAALRMPTSEELRGMAFTAIIHGATGLIFFALDSKVTREGLVLGIAPETPTAYDAHAAATPAEASRSRALWTGAASLNAELSRLTPELLSPTAGMSYRVYYSGASGSPSPVRTMLKVTGVGYTLFAANIENRVMGARFEFPAAIASVRRLNPDGSATELEPEGPTFRDTLAQFGVGVYQLRFKSGPAT